MEVTELEMKLIDEIVFSDHSTDGNGLVAWVGTGNGYPREFMNKMRGVMTSLQNKGIITVDNSFMIDTGASWLAITDEYQERISREDLQKIREPFMVVKTYGNGDKYRGLDWKALNEADKNLSIVIRSGGYRLKNIQLRK